MNDNRPANNRLISFTISAMLTSAFLATAPEGIVSAAAGPTAPSQAMTNVLNGLQASGWHDVAGLTATTPASVPVSVAAHGEPTPPQSPITGAQLLKVFNILMQTGTEASLVQRIAESLGLSKNGKQVLMRQLAIEDDNAVQYGFALLKDGRGYMLDKGPRDGNRIAFHLNGNLKIITAIAESSAREITILSPADAEARLREVMAVWAEYADQA